MEDEIKELSSNDKSAKEVTRLERFKGFVYRHRTGIIVVVGSVVTIGGVVLFVRKNPEFSEKAQEKIRQLIEGLSDDKDVGSFDIDILTDNGFEEHIEDAAGMISVPDEVDLGEFYSAKRLGEMIGRSPQWVNRKLHELGYLDGEPGSWTATEKGEAVSRLNAYDNGVGGYCRISNPYYEWKKDIIYELGNPEEYQAKIEQIRAESRKMFGEFA